MREDGVRRMIEAVERDWAYARSLTGSPAPDSRVLEALRRVPREEFVPPPLRPMAYENRALPIGEGQTISQPFIVALMTDLLRPKAGDVMLEVGTGSGYQAAVLSLLVSRVYSIEVVSELALRAAGRLQRLGFANVEVRSGDGYAGLPEKAPFDGILVTAAAPHVPPPLIAQLRCGARLVIPVGPSGGGQELTVVEKDEAGDVSVRKVLDVAFVPLTGSLGGDGSPW